MADAVSHVDAEAFQDYHREYAQDLLARTFLDETDDYTVHLNVKDKKVLNILEVEDLIKRYTEEFTGSADKIKILPKEAQVEDMSIELAINPKRFESSYLAQFLKQGQNYDINDMPFAAFILDQLLKQRKDELKRADVKGKKTATPLPSDPAVLIYDGIIELYNQEVDAGLMPFNVPGGVINQGNILDVLDGMEDRYRDSLQNDDDMLFRMEPALVRLAQKAMKQAGFGQTAERNSQGWVRNEFGTGWLVPKSKMKGTNGILLTPPSNIHLFMDGGDDGEFFNFQKDIRVTKMWCDFKRGLKLALAYDDCLIGTDTLLTA